MNCRCQPLNPRCYSAGKLSKSYCATQYCDYVLKNCAGRFQLNSYCLNSCAYVIGYIDND